MRDLEGYERRGMFQFPVEAAEPEPPRTVDRSLDDLDAGAYKARLVLYYAAAKRQLEGLDLTADQRQWAAGYHHGLQVALKLLDASGQMPAAPLPNGDGAAEEPHA